MTTMAKLVLALCAVVAVACTAPVRSPEPQVPRIAVPTMRSSPPGTPEPCPAAVTEGELVAHDIWGVAITEAESDIVRQVIWPYGFEGRREEAGVVLVDRAGRIVAREGDRVRIGGGETGGTRSWLACGGITVVRF